MPSRFPRPYIASAGPWVGTRDQIDPKTFNPSFAQSMLNVFPEVSVHGTGLRARPAWKEITTAAGALNSGSTIYGIYEHETTGGTNYTFVFSGDKMYRYSSGTFTDVTPVGVAINSSRVYCASLGGNLIVTDGTNRPWKGTNLGSTPITGAYLTGVSEAVWGPPVVYYAKVFFMKTSELSTIIWSEENDPDTGYEASGYNNSWTLGQTSQEPLYALAATNAALYYFRPHSIGIISGAVNDDFVSSGTHDAVSRQIGTLWPGSIVQVQNDIWFVDQVGRPWQIRGGELIPRWEALRQTLKNVNLNLISNERDTIQGAYQPATNLVLFAHHLSGSSATRFLVFDAGTGECYDQWTTAGSRSLHALATVTDGTASGRYRRAIIWGDSAGRVFREVNDSENDYRDTIDGTASTFQKQVKFTVGYDVRTEKIFDRLDVSMRQDVADADYTVTVGRRTPRGALSDLTLTVDGQVNDTETKGAVGMNAHGRWVEITLTESTNTGLTVFNEAVVSGTEVSDAPGLA